MSTFVIVWFMWQVLGRGDILPPIHKQLRKSPSWIGSKLLSNTEKTVTWTGCKSQFDINKVAFIKATTFSYKLELMRESKIKKSLKAVIDLKDLAPVLSQLLQMKLGVCGNALVFFYMKMPKLFHRYARMTICIMEKILNKLIHRWRRAKIA